MRILVLFITVIALTFQTQAQPQKVIKLKNEQLPYIPQNFHVQHVIDDRADTTVLGTMHIMAGLRKVTVILKDGPATAIGRFMDNNIAWNRSTPAVDMHILQLSLSENNTTMQQQLQIDGRVAFYFDGNAAYELSYSSFARGTNVEGYTETLVKQFLQGVLKEFDGWFENNKENTKSSVSVSVDMLRETDNEDLIVYDPKRPLRRSDFTGDVDDMSRAGAITHSGILIRYNYQTVLNKENIKITILPYFDKTLSWWIATESEPEVLAHEQLHFHITAIAACELLHTLRSYNFSPGNFTKEIDALQKQEERKRKAMQQQYDSETEHGQNREKQAEWRKQITTLLAEQDCY